MSHNAKIFAVPDHFGPIKMRPVGIGPAVDLCSPVYRQWSEPQDAPPEPERTNAEKYPVLASSGFVFADAIDLGPVVKPPCACPTCGRMTERVEF